MDMNVKRMVCDPAAKMILKFNFNIYRLFLIDFTEKSDLSLIIIQVKQNFHSETESLINKQEYFQLLIFLDTKIPYSWHFPFNLRPFLPLSFAFLPVHYIPKALVASAFFFTLLQGIISDKR